MPSPPATISGPRTDTLRVQTPFAPGSFLESSLLRLVKQTVLPQLHAKYRDLAVTHIRRAVAAERAKQEARIRALEGRIAELEVRDRQRETAAAEKITAATAQLEAEFELRVAKKVAQRLNVARDAWQAQFEGEAPQLAERLSGELLAAAQEFFRENPLDDVGGDALEEPGAGA